MKYKVFVCYKKISLWFSYLVSRIFYRNISEFKKEEIHKILIISLDYIGDYVMTTPVLSAIRENFPKAKVWMLAGEWTRELSEANPNIDRVVVYNASWLNRSSAKMSIRDKIDIIWSLKKERFDLLIDLRGSIGTALLAAFKVAKFRLDERAYLAKRRIMRIRQKLMFKPVANIPYEHRTLLDFKIVEEIGILPPQDIKPFIPVKEESIGYVRNLFGMSDHKPIVAFFPEANSKFKRWQPEKWALLADAIIERYGANLLISGSGINGESIFKEIESLMKNKPVNVVNKTNLSQLVALISVSNLCICLDSGPMHIAAALNRPFVALFGPNSPEDCGPLGAGGNIICKPLGCRQNCIEEKDKHCAGDCMRRISWEEVFQASQDLLTKNN